MIYGEFVAELKRSNEFEIFRGSTSNIKIVCVCVFTCFINNTLVLKLTFKTKIILARFFVKAVK